MRRRDVQGAERMFAALAEKSIPDAYNDLQYLVQDYVDVHRVVLAWRAWSLLDLAGKENAHTLLRQSVRFCCDEEKHAKNDALRVLLPRLLETKGLLSDSPKQREATDKWIEELSHTIYASTRQQAAEAVAQALAEGFSPEDVGEAISLAANQLVLHDPGRKKEDYAGQADRQRPRRLGRRACLRRGQRLAEHRSREQPPQHRRQHDRRCLSHGRANERPESQALSV